MSLRRSSRNTFGVLDLGEMHEAHWVQFLPHFHAVFEKIDQIIDWRPHLRIHNIKRVLFPGAKIRL